MMGPLVENRKEVGLEENKLQMELVNEHSRYGFWPTELVRKYLTSFPAGDVCYSHVGDVIESELEQIWPSTIDHLASLRAKYDAANDTMSSKTIKSIR